MSKNANRLQVVYNQWISKVILEALRTISLAVLDLKKKPVNATKDVTEKLLPAPHKKQFYNKIFGWWFLLLLQIKIYI